jgi:glycosyltransferase involved in cell wall biosynthesis
MEVNNTKVSVIIPVYNAARYLNTSLEQIVNQTLKEIEIICVDDGSTDNSLEIIKNFAKKDERITIISQNNINAGAARNRGLAVAKGEYLSFLDADDMFEPDMLELAYITAKKNTAEIVVYRSNRYNELTGAYEDASWTVNEKLFPNKDIFSNMEVDDLFNAFAGWAWDKLYNRAFININGLYFQEQKWINDRFFVTCAFALAERICFVDTVLVTKRINNAGALTTDYTDGRKWKYWLDAIEKIFSQFTDWGILNRHKKNFNSFAIHSLLWNLDRFIGDSSFPEFYDYVKTVFMEKTDMKELVEGDIYDSNDYKAFAMICSSDYKEFKWNRMLQKTGGVNADDYLFPFELVPKGSKIVLYAAGSVGRKYYRQVTYANWCTIVAWVDKNSSNLGALVEQPERIKLYSFDYVVIGINSKRIAESVISDLESYGVHKNKIVWREPSINL